MVTRYDYWVFQKILGVPEGKLRRFEGPDKSFFPYRNWNETSEFVRSVFSDGSSGARFDEPASKAEAEVRSKVRVVGFLLGGMLALSLCTWALLNPDYAVSSNDAHSLRITRPQFPKFSSWKLSPEDTDWHAAKQ